MTVATPLSSANDIESFVAACRDILDASPHVAYEPSALAGLEPLVAARRPVSWDWYLRDPAGPLEGRWYDIVFTSAMNGGYFEAGADGVSRQWQTEGSGSQAMMDWVGTLRTEGLLPGVDFISLREGEHMSMPGEPDRDWRAGIDAAMDMHGAIYRPWRRTVVEEFAAVGVHPAAALVRALVDVDADGGFSGHLTLGHARLLARLLPDSFGADPFAKKAILALLLLTSHLSAHGCAVTADIPIPADYQIPRILAWAKVLRPSAAFEDALRAGALLAPAGGMVTDFRAAAVVAAHDLAIRTGAPDWIVDGALFGGLRRDPVFMAEALPPMRIAGTWF